MKRLLILPFFLLLACNNPEKENPIISEVEFKPTFSTSLKKAEEVLLKQEIIIQYLERAHQNIKIFPCEFEEDQNYYYFRFTLYDPPIHISKNLDYRIITYKSSFIILAKMENLDYQKANDALTLTLVQDSLITFEPETKIQCEVPYVNFIICKNDGTKIGYYDVDMIFDSIRNDPYKTIKEELFYPNCK